MVEFLLLVLVPSLLLWAALWIAAGQPRLAPPVDDGGVHRRVRKEVTEHLQDDFGATVLVEPVMNQKRARDG